MDQVGVAMKMRMLMLVWSAIVATTMDTVTGSSVKKPHIHPDDFVSKQVQFTSAMNVHDGSDVEALLSFRNAVRSNPSGSLLNWTAQNSQNVCSWNGVWCKKRTNRVVAITLPGFGLEGSLSPSLGSLSFLRTLNLSGNNLAGRIPPELGQLKELGILDLSTNFLSGPIPKSLCNCTRLQLIRLSANSLTGTIPT